MFNNEEECLTMHKHDPTSANMRLSKISIAADIGVHHPNLNFAGGATTLIWSIGLAASQTQTRAEGLSPHATSRRHAPTFWLATLTERGEGQNKAPRGPTQNIERYFLSCSVWGPFSFTRF